MCNVICAKEGEQRRDLHPAMAESPAQAAGMQQMLADMTGLTLDAATNLLEAAGGNLDFAASLHFDNGASTWALAASAHAASAAAE